MIVALKPGVTRENRAQLMDWLQNLGLHIHVSEGEYQTILGLVGDTSRVDIDLLKSLEMVETVKRVSEPFKQANRKFHPKDTIIEAGNARIGGGYQLVLANIVADVIIPLSAVVRQFMAPGAVFICSGIIEHRWPETEAALISNGFEILDHKSEEEWHCFVCR